MARVKMGSKENILERVTRSFPFIDTDHEYIHEGNFFESSRDFSLAASAVGLIVIHTPAVLYLHYRNEKISCSADKLTVELYEAPTVTVDTGVAVTPYNHNRISSIVSDSTVLKDPTVTANGTKILTTFLGGGTGTGSNRSGSETSSQNEWVLKRDTKYLIRVVNGSSATNIVQINPIWYEEGSA
jgi:hypothetical protein